MKAYFLLPGLLLSSAVLLSLNGCSCSWTGEIPAEYRHAKYFPIVAAVQGVACFETSEDSQSFVENYMPTNEIILNTNTVHGWVVQFQPLDKERFAEEYYILPGAARWNCDTNSQIISKDQTTCRTILTIPRNSRFVSHDWGMLMDDPIGEYEIIVFIDHEFAADFKFHVIAPNTADKR